MLQHLIICHKIIQLSITQDFNTDILVCSSQMMKRSFFFISWKTKSMFSYPPSVRRRRLSCYFVGISFKHSQAKATTINTKIPDDF